MSEQSASKPRESVEKPCPQCGSQTTVVRTGELRLAGWWCRKCNHWDKAIGRERKL